MSTFTKYATMATDPREVAPRTFRFVASTSAVDRDGDVIPDDAWDVSAFLRNPAILTAHDYGKLPVARAVRVTLRPLTVDVQFPPEGASRASDEAYALVAGGFVRAVSVGYRSLEPPRARPDGRGLEFTRVELLEVSLVAVPANQEALLAARLGGKNEPRYLVDPGAIVAAVRDAVSKAMRAELCRLGGRLGDTPEDCAAVLKRMRENPASDPAPLLVKMLTSRSDAPAAHDLAPGLGQRLDDGLRRDRDLPTRPLPPLQIPAKFLKAARA